MRVWGSEQRRIETEGGTFFWSRPAAKEKLPIHLLRRERQQGMHSMDRRGKIAREKPNSSSR
jgi:hypothetical protein